MSTVIQGFLEVKTQGATKWKKKYFSVDNGGYLYMSEKKGGKTTVTIPITPNSHVDSLSAMGEDSGFSVTGGNHDPYYLRADSAEVAQGWVRALTIMRGGGTTNNLTRQESDKQSKMKEAYANSNLMGARGGSTLERKKGGSGRTLDRKGKRSTDIEGAVPPPPPGASPLENPADKADSDSDSELKEDECDDQSDIYDAEKDEQEDEREIQARKDRDTTFDDGFIMHIRGNDYFVDEQGWEYYSSREAFLGGEKPIGRAILSMLV